jgi:hypothetical protein
MELARLKIATGHPGKSYTVHCLNSKIFLGYVSSYSRLMCGEYYYMY